MPQREVKPFSKFHPQLENRGTCKHYCKHSCGHYATRSCELHIAVSTLYVPSLQKEIGRPQLHGVHVLTIAIPIGIPAAHADTGISSILQLSNCLCTACLLTECVFCVDMYLQPPPPETHRGMLQYFRVVYRANCTRCPGCCLQACFQRGGRKVDISDPLEPLNVDITALCNSVEYTVVASVCTRIGCGGVAMAQLSTRDTGKTLTMTNFNHH